MIFTPYIFSADGEPMPVVIDSATASDLKVTSENPVWQTDWTSDYLSAPGIEKYAMKTLSGELVALAAYQIAGKKAYVYILYIESAPHSNPTINNEKKYSGIGAALIAFGIKFSIDNGCRGDVVFDAKTDELAAHYVKDFGAKPIPSAFSGCPKRFMLADEDAWALFSKYLSEEE